MIRREKKKRELNKESDNLGKKIDKVIKNIKYKRKDTGYEDDLTRGNEREIVGR